MLSAPSVLSSDRPFQQGLGVRDELLGFGDKHFCLSPQMIQGGRGYFFSRSAVEFSPFALFASTRNPPAGSFCGNHIYAFSCRDKCGRKPWMAQESLSQSTGFETQNSAPCRCAIGCKNRGSKWLTAMAGILGDKVDNVPSQAEPCVQRSRSTMAPCNSFRWRANKHAAS